MVSCTLSIVFSALSTVEHPQQIVESLQQTIETPGKTVESLQQTIETPQQTVESPQKAIQRAGGTALAEALRPRDAAGAIRGREHPLETRRPRRNPPTAWRSHDMAPLLGSRPPRGKHFSPSGCVSDGVCACVSDGVTACHSYKRTRTHSITPHRSPSAVPASLRAPSRAQRVPPRLSHPPTTA